MPRWECRTDHRTCACLLSLGSSIHSIDNQLLQAHAPKLHLLEYPQTKTLVYSHSCLVTARQTNTDRYRRSYATKDTVSRMPAHIIVTTYFGHGWSSVCCDRLWRVQRLTPYTNHDIGHSRSQMLLMKCCARSVKHTRYPTRSRCAHWPFQIDPPRISQHCSDRAGH